MVRYRLRTLLIVMAPGLCSVVGALIGEWASFPGEWLPSRDNALFAIGWGATIGVIPSVGTAALLADSQNHQSIVWWLGAIAVGAFSGASLYIFAVSTAAV